MLRIPSTLDRDTRAIVSRVEEAEEEIEEGEEVIEEGEEVIEEVIEAGEAIEAVGAVGFTIADAAALTGVGAGVAVLAGISAYEWENSVLHRLKSMCGYAVNQDYRLTDNSKLCEAENGPCALFKKSLESGWGDLYTDVVCPNADLTDIALCDVATACGEDTTELKSIFADFEAAEVEQAVSLTIIGAGICIDSSLRGRYGYATSAILAAVCGSAGGSVFEAAKNTGEMIDGLLVDGWGAHPAVGGFMTGAVDAVKAWRDQRNNLVVALLEGKLEDGSSILPQDQCGDERNHLSRVYTSLEIDADNTDFGGLMYHGISNSCAAWFKDSLGADPDVVDLFLEDNIQNWVSDPYGTAQQLTNAL